MIVTRPTQDRFDETLELLQASEIAVYGGSDWTENDLRAASAPATLSG